MNIRRDWKKNVCRDQSGRVAAHWCKKCRSQSVAICWDRVAETFVTHTLPLGSTKSQRIGSGGDAGWVFACCTLRFTARAASILTHSHNTFHVTARKTSCVCVIHFDAKRRLCERGNWVERGRDNCEFAPHVERKANFECILSQWQKFCCSRHIPEVHSGTKSFSLWCRETWYPSSTVNNSFLKRKSVHTRQVQGSFINYQFSWRRRGQKIRLF